MTGPMHHDLFVYEDDHELAGRIALFLQEGIDEGSKAIMVVDRRKSELLRDTLGSAGEDVQVIDCASHYTRPEAALADYDATLRQLALDGARSVRLFGELPPLDTEAEYVPWVAYEAILNRAFAHHPVWITCGYDTRAVPAAVMDGVRRAHPRVLGDTLRAAPEYSDPAELVRARTPQPVALPQLETLDYEGEGVAFRRRLRRRMSELAVPPADADAMLCAGDEVLANAQRHGGGARSIRSGHVEGQFVLEIADRGSGLDDPLAGYLPPRPAAKAGAGIWVARQLTRRLELASDGDGLTVRLWI
jgi:anti-sigma regulatory factor (Ser/Thr protein kinase)